MIEALKVEIDNLKEFRDEQKEENTRIHDRISNTRNEGKEERKEMEERITTTLNGIKTDVQGYMKAGIKWLIGVSGVLILGLLGIVGFFLNFVFQQILSKLP